MRRASPKFYIRTSEWCFVISSFSFLFIPESNFNGNNSQRIMAYMVGILFGFGLFSGLASVIVLDFKRRKANFKKYHYPGLLCFYKNRRAKICDSMMIVSILAFVISEKKYGLYHTLSLVLLALTVLLLYLHSIFNGNNYAYAFQKGV